ncbi:hypothetical protein FA13DRAFT_1718541 [Coprinellus micaceus]|uniref:Uncharacterized protein n=1 Tax=Coprinellus micaceus TaxID=71717 RepID=A0A4Y7SDA5_COPMI|nr:hypothetical protein FA13DRAFT_1718541 [Coprinellus micaceus]
MRATNAAKNGLQEHEECDTGKKVEGGFPVRHAREVVDALATLANAMRLSSPRVDIHRRSGLYVQVRVIWHDCGDGSRAGSSTGDEETMLATVKESVRFRGPATSEERHGVTAQLTKALLEGRTGEWSKVEKGASGFGYQFVRVAPPTVSRVRSANGSSGSRPVRGPEIGPPLRVNDRRHGKRDVHPAALATQGPALVGFLL